MATIVTRSGKGSALTHQEMDDNFTNLNTDLVAVEATADEATKLLATVDNKSGTTLAKGTPVYITGATGNTYHVDAARADTASKMPAAGVLAQQLVNDAEGNMIIAGYINGVDTSTFTAGDEIFVGATGGFTNSAPTGEGNLIQKLGVVSVIDATNGAGLVQGAGRTNATPNLDEDQFFLGNASGQSVAVDFSDSVDARIGAASIDALSDVDTTTVAPTDGQALVWDNTAGQWEPGTVSGSGINNVVEDTTPQLGGDLDTNGNKIYNASGKVEIEASGSNPILLTNNTSFAGDLNFYVFGYSPANWLGAYQYNTAGGYRLQRAIASGSTDDGSHNHDHRFYGADVTLKARVQADNANAPLTLDATSVTFANGSDLYTFPTSDGTTGQVLTTNGSGTLSFQDASGGDVVNDTTPQLGGNLDLNGNMIYNSAAGNTVRIDPTNGSSNAEIQFFDNGSGSITMQLLGDSTDLVGGSIEAKDESANRANFSFIAKQLDLTSDGGNLRLNTNSASESIVFRPHSSSNETTTLSTTGFGMSKLDCSTNMTHAVGGQAQIEMYGGRVEMKKVVEFPSYTTTDRNAISATAGMVLFNSSTSKLQVYTGSAWVDLH